MDGLGGCAGAVVDLDADRNEVSIVVPERLLQTTPGVCFGESLPRSGFLQRSSFRQCSKALDSNLGDEIPAGKERNWGTHGMAG